jgi:hypothetical protein
MPAVEAGVGVGAGVGAATRADTGTIAGTAVGRVIACPGKMRLDLESPFALRTACTLRPWAAAMWVIVSPVTTVYFEMLDATGAGAGVATAVSVRTSV